MGSITKEIFSMTRAFAKSPNSCNKHHTPDHTNLLKKYNLSKEDIITGVHCTAFAMVRKKRSWFCPSCSAFDKKPLIKAVKDYFLLIKPSITSKEFREFVHISSKDTANRLLVSMNYLIQVKIEGKFITLQKIFGNE
jgi:hypothetical protein